MAKGLATISLTIAAIALVLNHSPVYRWTLAAYCGIVVTITLWKGLFKSLDELTKVCSILIYLLITINNIAIIKHDYEEISWLTGLGHMFTFQ